MAIYEISTDKISEVYRTTFAALGIRERQDMQRILRQFIEVIAPDTMILAEEFGDWEDSKRRIDLLGLGKNGRLVVIELKRSEDGGHMDLQALRYAAMVSAMKFDQAVEAHRKYLWERGLTAEDAEQRIRRFLVTEDGPIAFSNKVSIVLAAADFSKEITSSVLWLNEQGLDVTCVRMRPHKFADRILLDIQQVIPLPEAAEFQIAIREKSMELESVQTAGRDFTKYWLRTASKEFAELNKRRLIYQIVQEAIRLDLKPEDICEAVPWRRSTMFLSSDGKISPSEIIALTPGKSPTRFFSNEDEVIHAFGRSYLLSNQWGTRTEEAVANILKLLPAGHGIECEAIQ